MGREHADYNTFCKSIRKLGKSRSVDSNADFVLAGTSWSFIMAFDASLKVMKDILVKYLGVLDFAIGSPRATLQTAYLNKLIFDDEWLQMLDVRNSLVHDYDGSYAAETFELIISTFYDCFEKFRGTAAKYYTDTDLKELNTFKNL